MNTAGRHALTNFLVLCIVSAAHNGMAQAPQSARQALVEMFFSKTQGTFVKHLPAATYAALEKSGALAGMQQYSSLMSQAETQNKHFQVFEAGPLLVSTEDSKTGQKFDVTVENDSLHGDQDDITVTFETYKNGEAQRTPFMPRVTFSMKTESGVWKLNEISVIVRLPLADPDFLKAITEGAQSRFANARVQQTAPSQPATSGQPPGANAAVLAAMRSIVTAENTYASTYKSVGYTCSLSDLDGFGGGEPNEHQAMLIHSGLASGKRYGYVFALSGCGSARAATFTLTAVPTNNAFGEKAFCTDQTGTIRSSGDGSATSCLTAGTPVQQNLSSLHEPRP